MKNLLKGVVLSFLLSAVVLGNTPTEALKLSVNQLIAIAAKSDVSDADKKFQLTEIINAEVDFNAVSKRIILKKWKKATTEQKQKFKKQFSIIMVDTYADLLKNYTNEKVLYVKEQIKRERYAIVDTQVITGNKKIPIRYRLIKIKEHWKIYDFVIEGISIVSTYKNNYKRILKKDGLDALLVEMVKAKSSGKKD